MLLWWTNALKFSQVILCIMVELNASILEDCFWNAGVCLSGLNNDAADHLRVFSLKGAPFQFLRIYVMIWKYVLVL
jgi:hypothetical protein